MPIQKLKVTAHWKCHYLKAGWLTKLRTVRRTKELHGQLHGEVQKELPEELQTKRLRLQSWQNVRAFHRLRNSHILKALSHCRWISVVPIRTVCVCYKVWKELPFTNLLSVLSATWRGRQAHTCRKCRLQAFRKRLQAEIQTTHCRWESSGCKSAF